MDEENRSASPYAALDERPRKQRLMTCARCARCAGRMFLCSVFLSLSFAVGLLVVPNYIVAGRVKQAKVQVLGGTMRISAHEHEVLNPAAHIFADKRLLQFLGVSYTAHVRPFKASIHLNVPSGVSMNDSPTKGSGFLKDLQTEGRGLAAYIKQGFLQIAGVDLRSEREKKPLMKLGEISVSELVLDSSEHFNETIGGQFELTAPIDHLAFAANEFLSKPSVNATMTATMSVFSKLWGVIPVYFPRIHVEYEYVAAAFDDFHSQQIHVSDLLSCEGFQGYMRAEATAGFYNPTPFSFQLETPLSMRVDHSLHGQDHTVGYVSFSHLKVNPGRNNITANFSVVQTDTNADALEDLFTRYLAEKEENLPEGADQHIYVAVRDAGEDTASSELVRKTASLMSTKLGFFPPGKDYIEGVSADLVFIGSLFTFHPAFYHVTMNMKIQSALPQDVSISYLDVKAFRDTIDGEIMYAAQRELNPSFYNVPALAKDHFIALALRVSEVELGISMTNFLYMCQSGLSETASLGFESKIEVNIGPGGFKQTLRYKRRRIVAMMCYHMANPPWRCGEHMQIWSEIPGNLSSLENHTEPQRLPASASRYV
mmetsp:Transcript_140427/g.261800  ORF Transcript_140427/g.261800 Transcript_140427/m.261800 type:complete len:598 (-) Transcript_140427:37-1830(-)